MSAPRTENSLFFPVNFSEAGGKQHKPAVYAGLVFVPKTFLVFPCLFPVLTATEDQASRLDCSVDPNRARSAADLKQRAAAIHGALNVILLHRALHGDRMMDLHTP